MANTRIPQLPPVFGVSGAEQLEIVVPTGDPIVPYTSARATIAQVASAASTVNLPVVLATASPLSSLGRVLTGTANDISVTDNGAGTTIVLDLVSTAVTPSTYGSATQVPRFTVDQKGRITGVSNVAITAGTGTVTNAANLANNALVVGDGGTVGIKTALGMTTDGTSKITLGVAGASVGALALANATSGTITLQPVTGALGSAVLSLPATTDTLIGKATTDILTNKTFDTAGAGNSLLINGVAATANAGSGAVVRATSPTIVTPTIAALANLTTNGLVTTSGGVGTLGVTVPGTGIMTWLATPSSANLAAAMTDETGTGALVFGTSPSFTTDIRPASNGGASLGISGTAWSTLYMASAGVINFNAGNYTITHSAGLLTTNGNLSLTTAGVLTTGTIELGAASDTTISRSAAGVIAVEGLAVYSNIPQNSQSAAYTTVLADAQKHLLHPTADNNARTFTIDSNANVAYPIGTAITFINEINTLTIAITSDTLVLAGAGTTGSRSLAAMGMATAIKKTTTSWIISGAGLT